MPGWLKRLFARPLRTRVAVRSIQKLLAPDRAADVWQEGVHSGPTGRLAYRLFLPTRSSATERVPLLVMLHGCKQDAALFAAGTRMNRLAEARGFAVLYPEQSRRANFQRCWNWFHADAIAGGGEAALIVAAVNAVSTRQPIDATRIYVAGMSAGGAMAALLAARYSTLFAACGIHSGIMFNAAMSAVQALRVMRSGAHYTPEESAQGLVRELAGELVFVPTIVIHGSADAAVNPVNFSQLIQQLCAVATRLAPAGAPAVEARESSYSEGGRRCQQQDFSSGDQLLVRSLAIDHLGHAWSGGDARFAFHDADGPDASVHIAEFVLHYRRAPAGAKAGSPLSPSARSGA